jgi:hypothetical protein
MLLLIGAALAGCAETPVPPSKLAKPASTLMVPPQELPDIFDGDDIGQHAIVVRSMYGKEAGKLRRLQRYVRTVTK